MSEWLPYHLMNTDVFALIGNKKGSVNTADYPALEFEMSRLQSGGVPEFKSRLRKSFDIARIREAMVCVPSVFSADYLAQVDEHLGSSSITRRWKALMKMQDLGDKKNEAELYYRKIKMNVLKRVNDIHAYGYQLLKLKRYDEAVDVFHAVLEKDANSDNVYYNLVVCYEALGYYNKALKAFYMKWILTRKMLMCAIE